MFLNNDSARPLEGRGGGGEMFFFCYCSGADSCVQECGLIYGPLLAAPAGTLGLFLCSPAGKWRLLELVLVTSVMFNEFTRL